MVPPWSPPTTWGQLRGLLGERWREVHAALRGKDVSVLLLGMPTPENYGEPPAQVHWQGVEVPNLGGRGNTSKRRGTDGRALRDDMRRSLTDDRPIVWIYSENWSRDQLARRLVEGGREYPDDVLIVGCGAIGSVLAECLARGGARRFWLCDSDVITGGNLVRSAYRIADVGRAKVGALAQRIAAVSPHASADVVEGAFHIGRHGVPMGKVRWVFDCSSDDAVLRDLACLALPLAEDAQVVSLSVSSEAKRLLMVRARAVDFDPERTIAALNAANPETPLAPARAEGVGCYHPAFPADPHRVTLHAMAALERILSQGIGPGEAVVETFDMEGFTWTRATI